jgi:hypothetical protein
MFIGGSLWVDAKLATGGEVIPWIRGQICGDGQLASPPGGGPFLFVRVRSDAEQPGCGKPGDPITITLDGRAINETIPWAPGMQQPTTLIAGPPFALISGTLQLDPGYMAHQRIRVTIGSTECGGGSAHGPDFPDSPGVYSATIYSEQMQVGCGRDGAMVTLVLEPEGMPAILLGTVPWVAMPLVVIGPTVDVRGMVPLTPLAVGQ